MKIGLLECDHVLPDLRSFGGDYRDMFPLLLPEFRFINFDICNGQFPRSASDCDAWLCTGSKYSVYDEIDWILELKDFVREIHRHHRKYVGVCFGHQMLGEALGGKVQKSPAGWCVGVHGFQVTEPRDWMIPFQLNYHLLMSCQDQVIEMPADATLLASAEDCRVAMFQVGSTMLGLQAHPEFPVKYAEALMGMRTERIGTEKVNAARQSLEIKTDEKVVAQWISRFLKR